MRRVTVTRDRHRLTLRIEEYDVGRKDEMMDDAVSAYEESTGQLPDTAQYVVLEDLVNDYVKDEES